MCGDRLGLLWRTTWTQFLYLPGHLNRQFAILLPTGGASLLPRDRPRVRIEGAFLLGLFQRRLFDQNSLPFVASTRLAIAHYHCGTTAVFRGPSESGRCRRQ